jgi:hypothetical protein
MKKFLLIIFRMSLLLFYLVIVFSPMMIIAHFALKYW